MPKFLFTKVSAKGYLAIYSTIDFLCGLLMCTIAVKMDSFVVFKPTKICDLDPILKPHLVDGLGAAGILVLVLAFLGMLGLKSTNINRFMVMLKFVVTVPMFFFLVIFISYYAAGCRQLYLTDKELRANPWYGFAVPFIEEHFFKRETKESLLTIVYLLCLSCISFSLLLNSFRYIALDLEKGDLAEEVEEMELAEEKKQKKKHDNRNERSMSLVGANDLA